MGDTKSNEFWQGAGKFLAAGAYIAMGLMAKFAIESRYQKLTKAQLWGKGSISFVVGFCSFMACYATNRVMWAAVVTPISTIVGDTIAIYIFTHITGWMDYITDKFKKTNNDTK